MSHPLKHPKAKQLLKRMANAIRSKKTFVLPNKRIAFVCGGRESDSVRTKFIGYAEKNFPLLRIFLAENTYKELDELKPGAHNLVEFEDFLAEIADCIILFPESHGSVAELGYFSNSVRLRRKLLVANDAALQSEDSFISLGPIDLVDRYSKFKPTIQLPDSSDASFDLVRDRLKNRFSGKSRKRFGSISYGELSIQQKFFTTFEIVSAFGPITFQSIIDGFNSVWGHAKRKDLRQITAVLIGASYIGKHESDEDYYFMEGAAPPFLDFDGIDIDQYRLEISDFYARNFPKIHELLVAKK